MNIASRHALKFKNFFHHITHFRFSNIFFSVAFLLLDSVFAFFAIIIFTSRLNVDPSAFLIARILASMQGLLESFLFRVDPSPWIVWFFLGAAVAYVVIRMKRNITRLFSSSRQYWMYFTAGLSFFLLLVLPFIIIPNIFYPRVSLPETSSSLNITSNLHETAHPLRRISRFFGAFAGRGCSYENISWSETNDVLYFSSNKNCGKQYFAYDTTTRTLSQKPSLPDDRSTNTPSEEELRFPDFIGTNYTIKNFPSPSGEWVALLVSYMNFDRLQDVILVHPEDVKFLE